MVTVRWSGPLHCLSWLRYCAVPVGVPLPVHVHQVGRLSLSGKLPSPSSSGGGGAGVLTTQDIAIGEVSWCVLYCTCYPSAR